MICSSIGATSQFVIEFPKRLVDRIFARAAQHRVLENMGGAGGTRRRDCETDANYLVFVAIDKREQLGTGLAKERKTVAHGRLGHGYQGLPKQPGVQSAILRNIMAKRRFESKASIDWRPPA
jgi:hypothetical protein